jgi:AraC family transcriptional regulator
MADAEETRAGTAEAWSDETYDSLPTAGVLTRISSRFKSWPGITAECVEMQGSGRHPRALRSDRARLVVILDSVGRVCEIRSAVTSALCSHTNGFNLVSTIPAGIDAWLHADGITYLRFVVVGFDLARWAPCLPDRPTFATKTMVADPTLFQYGKLIADACEGLVRSAEPDGECLGRAALLASVSLASRVASGEKLLCLAPWQLRRVAEFVEKNPTDPPTLLTLANICRLSPSHFGRAFKGSTGVPPHRWMRNMRIRYAQSLLVAEDASIAEVASLAGFADQSHFTRIFVKATGRTPAAWRREISARLGAFDDPSPRGSDRQGERRNFTAIRQKNGRDGYQKSPRRSG